MAAPPPPRERLQQTLQSAVQAVQWTYCLFWQFCPQQGVLVWSDGYYNGAIKTRKTVQPMEVSAGEASLQRSQQLRELYDSLSAGETGQPARRPCAALSPEDLTESEWFYLMCVSFSFPPGAGLPGRAYAKRQHVWLTGAHEVDSKVFSRAILAKSARIQTVVCIPLMDAVVEVGSTERVQEDPTLIQQLKTFFVDHRHPPPKPALSEHSTSDHPPRFHSPAAPTAAFYSVTDAAGTFGVNHVNQEVDDDVDNEDVTNESAAAESDSDAETGWNSRLTPAAGQPNPPNHGRASNSVRTTAERSELMQLDMSEDIRLGSPDDACNNLDSDFPVMGGGVVAAGAVNFPANVMMGHHRRAHSFSRAESTRRWPVMPQDPLRQQPPIPSQQPPPSSGAPPLEELTEEDTHYSQTVCIILQHKSIRSSSEPSPTTTVGGGQLSCSTPNSAFSNWPPQCNHLLYIPPNRPSQPQWLLKHILITVPFLHTRSPNDNSIKTQDSGPDQNSLPHDELSASHVLAERRRREKLNERFIILRSLVPFVTKMDKASILGDTIEYVKQLRRKVQDLESCTSQMESERARAFQAAAKSGGSSGDQQRYSGSGVTVVDRACLGSRSGSDKRKVRVMEGSGGGGKVAKVVESPPVMDMLQVSIIESDALIELHCPYREGLVLDVMLTLREMRMEITAVQSSLNNGFFTAELRAKVKENVNGKRASIVEVKRAINQIVPHTDDS